MSSNGLQSPALLILVSILLSGAGNLLSRLGEGNVGGALNQGLKTAQRVGLSKPMAGKIGRIGHGLINQIQAI